MKEYHYIWLNEHPNRTAEWLKDKLMDGFHIHHIDGNHENNNESNLVLIDGADHFLIHNGKKRAISKQLGSNKENRIRKRLWITPCGKYYMKLKKWEKPNTIALEYYSLNGRLKSVDDFNGNENAFYLTKSYGHSK